MFQSRHLHVDGCSLAGRQHLDHNIDHYNTHHDNLVAGLRSSYLLGGRCPHCSSRYLNISFGNSASVATYDSS